MRTSASYSTFGPTSLSTRRRIGEPAIDASPRPSSPPIEVVRGEYRFVFMRTRHGDEDRTVVRIDFHDEPGAEPLIRTSVSGALQPLDAVSARRALWSHPLMTLAVIARIHWQALLLWRKRIPFFRQPPAPSSFVTAGHPTPR